MSDKERIQAEQRCLNLHRDYSSVIELINDRELAFLPGTTGFASSETELVVLAEILCRITGLSLFDTMKRYVFDPFGMSHVKEGQEADTVSYKTNGGKELVRTPLDYVVKHVFTMDAEDAAALAKCISMGAGLKPKTWRMATKCDEDNLGLLFENINGFYFSDIHLLGTLLCFYCNFDTQLAYVVLGNEDQIFENIQGEWQYFRKGLRKAIDSIFTYPVKPKMVKINKDNLWDALGITVSAEQLDFVLEAKSSIAMGLLYKTKRVFVQMEGTKTIGLLVMDVDHKKKFYNIDIIQIDQRFQGRGYGKLMLAYAIDYLKKAGAKELEIGVNRKNKAAQKIYTDAGFTPKSIFEGGMHLHMTLE